MGSHWLCSSLIIIAIISTSNTQNIIQKWKLENKKENSMDTKKNSYLKKIKSIELSKNEEKLKDSKQFEKLLLNDKDAYQRDYKLNEKISSSHSRKKRLIWVTEDGRLALPPGTVLSISPTISLPFIRYPPSGFLSNLTVSLPLTIDFDKLGLTDNENPLGTAPPLFGRSMGRAAGSILANYIGQYLTTRKRRETVTEEDDDFIASENKINELPELPEEHKNVFHGGERALLYGVVEDLISNFGLNGKACLLRAICEVHSKSVHSLGLLGEMVKLFFTASKSKFSDLLPEYVSAQKMGEGTLGPGECFPYYKECPRSLFKKSNHRYSEFVKDNDSDDTKENNVDEKVIQLESNEVDHDSNDQRYKM